MTNDPKKVTVEAAKAFLNELTDKEVQELGKHIKKKAFNRGVLVGLLLGILVAILGTSGGWYIASLIVPFK